MWHKKKRLDPDVLSRQADAATQQLEEQQTHVNALTAFLVERNLKNGFGDDFEFTFYPKGSR